MSAYADSLRGVLNDPNIRAFFRLIREGESSQGDKAYHMRWGGTGKPPAYFDDLSKHPRIYEPGPNGPSSASGAFQITASTYDEFAPRLGITDFSRESQELIALAIIHKEGALNDVLGGNLVAAINKLGGRWASLPSSTYGQPTQKLARLIDVFEKYGGQHFTQALVPAAGSSSPQHPRRDAPPESAPITTPEKPMLPLAVITGLIQAAATVVPEIGKLFLDPNKTVRERNVEAAAIALGKLADATRPADTPPEQWNEQKAVEAMVASKEAAEKGRAAFLDDYDRMLGMVIRAREADDTSMDRAAARIRDDDEVKRATPVLVYGALGGVALVFLTLTTLLILQTVLMADHKPAEALVVLFVTVVGQIIGFAAAIYMYRFGSSSGSKASGDAVRAIAESRK